MHEGPTAVLVADDNDGVRQTTALILRVAGYDVDEAGDGEEALRKIAANAYDVAILDVRMPKRDGIWVVEHLEATSAPKVVLDSAYDVGGADRARLGPRVFRYLRKPVPPAQLLEAVEAAAAQKALAAETTSVAASSSVTHVVSIDRW
jgi:two-component system, NtrC family, response regulator HydG